MKAKLHVLIYVIISLYILSVIPNYVKISPEVISFGVFLGAIYALLPDIDTHQSKIRGIFERLGLLSSIILAALFLIFRIDYLLWICLAILMILLFLFFVKHRGFTHSLLFGIISSGIWYFIDPALAFFAFSGFIFHKVLDIL